MPNAADSRRAYALGRKALSELDTLVTPDTLMRWYRTLVAQKWTYAHRSGPGRPRTIQVIVQLIVRMALEPAPERGKHTPWSTFLKTHWESIAATDFFSVEVLTLRGLVTYYILFVIDWRAER